MEVSAASLARNVMICNIHLQSCDTGLRVSRQTRLSAESARAWRSRCCGPVRGLYRSTVLPRAQSNFGLLTYHGA